MDLKGKFMKSLTKLFLKAATTSVVFAVVLTHANLAFAEWSVDLSRRQKAVQAKDMQEMRKPASASAPEGKSLMDVVFQGGDPLQEIVVLNTDKGFIPNTLRIRQGSKYKIHIVNVNDKEKNVSFVLDSFGEHHATYYGKIKSFYIEPKKEGIYSFECPETSNAGRLIVFANPGAQNIRVPATASQEDSK